MLKQKLREDGIYLIKMALTYVVLMLIVYVLSGVVGDILQERENVMATQDEMIPPALLEFAGLQKLGQFPAKMEVFFLGLMILNLVTMAIAFIRGFSAMRGSFTNSRFAFFYMQIMPLWKNYVFTIGGIMLTSLLSWGMYILTATLFGNLLTAEVHTEDAALLQGLVGEMGIRGIVLILFMTALGAIFGMAQRQRIPAIDLSLGWIGLSFVIGNFYKIPQYIGYTQVQQMINAKETMETARALKELRILCPYAWLNPVNIYNEILDANQLWWYLLVAVLLIVIGGLWYCKRDWMEV